MRAFEYTVSVLNHGGDPTRQRLEELCNRAGRNGWRLTNVMSPAEQTNIGTIYVFFEREMQSAGD